MLRMSSRRAAALALVAVVTVVFSLDTSAAVASSAAVQGSVRVDGGGVGVGHDDARDQISGDGNLLLPGSFDGDPAVRDEAASCAGCHWRVVIACFDHGDATNDACAAAHVGCPPPALRYNVYLMRPGDADYLRVGDVCLGPDEQLTTVAHIGDAVRDQFADRLPAPRATFQPSTGALVNIPTLFASHQSTTFGPDGFDVLGHRVEVTATAAWHWAFGDGADLVTTEPGGAYPNKTVAHTYLHRGTMTATVTTTWTGSFTVDGYGPFPVSGEPVRISDAVQVRVREAGATLLAPQ